jgi:hypothetical protein
VPPTTVSRIYAQLRSEGLLTAVWGSKTFITPTRIDSKLRIRGVVALPASLVSFCAYRQYRNFFFEIRDALWKFGFAPQLLFYEDSDVQFPTFAEGLLKHKLDIVIWFLPNAKSKETIARLLDRGIRVVSVADSARDCREHLYYLDRGPAIRDALLHWREDGIRSVAVLHNSGCSSSGTITLLEKCLREMAMPYAFANPESLERKNTAAPPVQPVTRGIIFPSVELAVPFIAGDPARFAKLSKQSRVLLMNGPIDVPGLSAIEPSSDLLQFDLQSIAKRIVSDLMHSNSRGSKPATFQAEWVPRPIEKRAATSFRLSATEYSRASSRHVEHVL